MYPNSEQYICGNKMWVLEMILVKPVSESSYVQLNKASINHMQL